MGNRNIQFEELPLTIKPKNILQTTSNNHPVNIRYSDNELREFKELITLKLNKSKEEYILLKETLASTDDNGTNDTLPASKLSEDGPETIYKEETAIQAIRLDKYIKHLQNALIRIENKTYGICSLTGELISKERLKSVPHSTLCIKAKLQLDNR